MTVLRKWMKGVPLVLALAACSGSESTGPGSPTGPVSRVTLPFQAPSRGSIPDHFRYLSEVAPGFTGVYFDEAGELTVVVARDDFGPESLEKVLAWARVFSSSAAEATSAKLKRVTYDYRTFSENYSSLNTAIRSDDLITTTRIDETRGLLVIGLESLSQSASLLERLVAAGVARDMIEVQQEARSVPETTLNEKYRPLVGGLQIQNPHLTNPCTLGYVILKRGEDGYSPDPSLGRFFLTAAHCSPTWGIPGGHIYYQHIHWSGNRIGVEVAVAPKLSGGSCPSGKSPCQHADVLVGRSDDSVSTLYLRVADVNPPSKTIIGHINLQGAPTVGGLTGETVTKVGSATGKTTGKIIATCVDVKMLDVTAQQNIWVLCQQRADYHSSGNDSGAPVFIPYSPSNWNTPRLVGIHSSQNVDTGHRHFSPMSQIDYALNYAYYFF